MASIRKQLEINADASKTWAVLRAVGEAHKAFGPVLTDSRLNGGMRTATFANGMVVHERILHVDDHHRRVAYTVTDAPGVAYHHASMEVIERGPGRCDFVWITDLDPPEAAPAIAQLVDAGAAALKANIEKSS